MIELDCFGETCPKPVVRALQALADPASAGAVRVAVDNEVAVENLRRLAASRKTEARVEEIPGGWSVEIVEAPGAGDGPEAPGAPAASGTGEIGPVESDAGGASADAAAAVAAGARPDAPAVVLIGGAGLGRGDDELGGILMRGVLYALSQRAEVPRTIIFYNGGARLTSAGSPALEDIRELERRGTEVLTCGTCLDYLGITDELAVGGVTNLYAITEAMMGTGRVVTL